MKWLLLIWFTTIDALSTAYIGSNVGVQTIASFNSETKCLTALQKIKQTAARTNGVCVTG